jgi:hypothetical protein
MHPGPEVGHQNRRENRAWLNKNGNGFEMHIVGKPVLRVLKRYEVFPGHHGIRFGQRMSAQVFVSVRILGIAMGSKAMGWRSYGTAALYFHLRWDKLVAGCFLESNSML